MGRPKKIIVDDESVENKINEILEQVDKEIEEERTPLREGCLHDRSEVRNYNKDTQKGDLHCKDCAGYVGQYNDGVITNIG